MSGREVGNLNEAMAAVMAARGLDDRADCGKGEFSRRQTWLACRGKSPPVSSATASLFRSLRSSRSSEKGSCPAGCLVDICGRRSVQQTEREQEPFDGTLGVSCEVERVRSRS